MEEAPFPLRLTIPNNPLIDGWEWQPPPTDRGCLIADHVDEQGCEVSVYISDSGLDGPKLCIDGGGQSDKAVPLSVILSVIFAYKREG